MNAQNVAVAPKKTAPMKPADDVRYMLEKMKPQLALALPKHLTADRLLRVAMTAIQQNPKLLECDRMSLLGAIMMCAQLGLEPDGVLGQAYLIPFAGRVQFIPGYKGLITLARNSGDVSSIVAHEVRENDHFEFSFGLSEKLEHTPARGDRGEITYFYAIARFKDGGYHWDVMTREEVEAIRDASSGYSMAKKYAKNGVVNSPWVQHFAEMGKKTVIRRIAKYLPMSVQKAAAAEDMHEAGKHLEMNSFGDIVVDTESKKAITQEQEKPTEQTQHDSITGEAIEPEAQSSESGDQLEQFEKD